MTDQQRFDTVGALGNRMIRTPALDRLCREGAAFTRAYTPCPVCVAARSALLTGLAPHVTGCVDNSPTPLHATSLMQYLADAGYQTHGVGKMHFKGDIHAKWGFESRDVSEEEPDADDDYVRFLKSHGYGHVTSPHGMRSEMYYVPQPSQLPAGLHHTAWTADRSIDFLRRRDRRRPFFLFTSFIKPHPPFENPTPWNQLYRGPEMPGPHIPEDSASRWTYWNRVQNRYKQYDGPAASRLDRTRQAGYYASISFIDFHLRRILEHLGDTLEDTLVIFTSDHGELLGDFGCVGKRSMHDASCRIPLIVRWPGRRHAGLRVDRPATLLDILPTCLASAGLPTSGRQHSGVDLDRLARDPAHDQRVVYSQFQRGRYALYLAASSDLKYVRSAPDERQWLFAFGGRGCLERDVTDLPRYRQQGRRLERQLVRRLEADGDTHATHDGRWIAYEPPRWPSDPDAGLIFQDPDALADHLQALGPDYARPIPPGFYPQNSPLSAPDPFRLKPEPAADVRVRLVKPKAPKTTTTK